MLKHFTAWRALCFTVALSALPAAHADDRINVMQCTDEEVKTFLARPNAGRQIIIDYHEFEKAHAQSEIKKADNARGRNGEKLDNPEVCFGMLYGDLGKLGDQIKDLGNIFNGFQFPNVSQLMSEAMDKLSESICGRVNAGTDAIEASVKRNADRLKQDALNEVERRYGERALNNLVNEAFIPPEYQSVGLKFRNSKIDKDEFQKGLRGIWKDKMDELVDDL